MKNTIFKISMVAMLCIAMNTAKAQLVAPTGTDILWVVAGLTGINTALINIIDSSTDDMNYPYKQLGACAYDGTSTGGGGVVVTDFRSGWQVNTVYTAGGFSGNHMASVPDVIIGNKSGSTMDFIMAVAFVNDAGQIEVDYFDITYTTFFVFTVTYNSSDLINPVGGGFYTPGGTVHIDVVAQSSSLTPYGLPYCNTFFLTWDELDLITPGPSQVFASYGNLNGYTALTAGPQQISMTCMVLGDEGYQPDVAGVERPTGVSTYNDIGCFTYPLAADPFGGRNCWLFYAEWDPSSGGPLCGGKIINYQALGGSNTVPLGELSVNWIPEYHHPRIDAVDDYNVNGGVSACNAKIVAEAYHEFPTFGYTFNDDIGIYSPGSFGGLSTTPWIEVDPLEFPIGSGIYPFDPGPGASAYDHFAPAVAYGQGGGTEYMVTECTVESTGDFFMMSPIGVACSTGLSGSNFYAVNRTYPATSSNHANAVSTPVNMTWDTSLTTWPHNSRIYYKRSGPAYAYKPSQGNTTMNEAELSIWPNPTNGLLTISNPDNAANGYAIKNFLGQTMMTAGLKAGQQSIDISHLIPGHYVINFHKNGEASGNEQFIKK